MSGRRRGRPRESTAEALAAELGAEAAAGEAEGAAAYEPERSLVPFLLSRVPSVWRPELEQMARELAGAPEAQLLRSVLERWQVLATFDAHEELDGELQRISVALPGVRGADRMRRRWVEAIAAEARREGVESALSLANRVWDRMLGKGASEWFEPINGRPIPAEFHGLRLFGRRGAWAQKEARMRNDVLACLR